MRIRLTNNTCNPVVHSYNTVGKHSTFKLFKRYLIIRHCIRKTLVVTSALGLLPIISKLSHNYHTITSPLANLIYT